MPDARSADLLILAAFAPELAGFRGALDPGLSGIVSGVHVACATIGVGLPAAAAGVTQRLREVRARAVLLVGSCGVYPGHAPFVPLQAVIPTQVTLVDASVLAQKAAFPGLMELSHATHEAMSDGLAAQAGTALRGALATTLSLTTDDALAHSIGEHSACVAENLEALAVVAACTAQSPPCACLTIATNAVGSLGREQWRTYHGPAAERAAQLTLSWLESGAPGL
jgi:nucleoside phosphorylase